MPLKTEFPEQAGEKGLSVGHAFQLGPELFSGDIDGRELKPNLANRCSLDHEALPTAARLLDVRVVEDELRRELVLDEIHLRAYYR